MKLYYEQYGQGPALVLLHGWGLHGGVWSKLIPALAAHFHLIVVDLPGHGCSRELPAEYSWKNLVESIVAVLPGPAHWLGWSLGGLIALNAARYWTEAVKKMILVSATPKFIQSEDWRCAVAESVLQQFAQGLAENYRATLQRFLSLQLGAEARNRAWLRELRALLLARGAPQPAALQAGLNLFRDTDLRQELSAIAAPTQVLHGARDKLVPLPAGEYLAAQLPNARMALLPAAGHAPFLSHAQEFTAALLPFLYD